MEHAPRAYRSVQEVLHDMDRTIMEEVVREVMEQASASLPLEIICVNHMVVKLIVALDYVEGAVKPFVVRAWDWIPKGPAGRSGTVRGTLQIWAMNATSEVIYRAVYPPERLEVE